MGSTAHGLSRGSRSDRDELAICIEPPASVIGLEPFEVYAERTQPEGMKSGPGDLDLTVYSLRRFVKLAARGNPTLITLLFLPQSLLLERDHWGFELLINRRMLFSRRAASAYLGYMKRERERLEGLRGGGKNGWHKELVRQHGYDVKNTAHMVRLGYQGLEFIRTGHVTLPVPEPQRSEILAVRAGEVSQRDVLAKVEALEAEIKAAVDTSPLREEPDWERIEAFLVEAYRGAWSEADQAGARRQRAVGQ